MYEQLESDSRNHPTSYVRETKSIDFAKSLPYDFSSTPLSFHLLSNNPTIEPTATEKHDKYVFLDLRIFTSFYGQKPPRYDNMASFWINHDSLISLFPLEQPVGAITIIDTVGYFEEELIDSIDDAAYLDAR